MFCIVIIVCTDEEFLLHVLHYILSNDSRVCKSDEELMSAFKIFILHAEHCDSSSFFVFRYAAKQFKQNLCSHFNTFISFFSISPQLLQQQRVICGLISLLLTSSNFTTDGIPSDSIWEERKLQKLWVQVELLILFFGLPFQAAFT